MKITLDHNEILEAITRFVTLHKVSHGKVNSIKLTAGRKGKGYSAEVDVIFNDIEVSAKSEHEVPPSTPIRRANDIVEQTQPPVPKPDVEAAPSLFGS